MGGANFKRFLEFVGINFQACLFVVHIFCIYSVLYTKRAARLAKIAAIFFPHKFRGKP